MKLVFAPDSFKGSLRSAEMTEILSEEAAKVFPEAEIVCIPIADGGEGTVEALIASCGGTLESANGCFGVVSVVAVNAAGIISVGFQQLLQLADLSAAVAGTERAVGFDFTPHIDILGTDVTGIFPVADAIPAV